MSRDVAALAERVKALEDALGYAPRVAGGESGGGAGGAEVAEVRGRRRGAARSRRRAFHAGVSRACGTFYAYTLACLLFNDDS